MKLFVVEVVRRAKAVIAAENQHQAQRIADSEYGDILDGEGEMPLETHLVDLKASSNLPPGWCEDTLVFETGYGTHSVKEWREKIAGDAPFEDDDL